jgi:cytochrome c
MLTRNTMLVAGMALALAVPSLAHATDPWEGGDATAGKAVFQKCGLCHYAEPNKVKIGPPLWGVVGRPSGSIAGYSYSTAMKGFNKTWTPEELYTYLEAPQKVVVGTKMAFAGLKSPDDRKNVIAYLETLK